MARKKAQGYFPFVLQGVLGSSFQFGRGLGFALKATSRVSGFSGCIQAPVRVGTLTSSDTNEHLLVSYAAHGRSKLIALIFNVLFCSVIHLWNECVKLTAVEFIFILSQR